MVYRSGNGNELSKRILAFLIEKSTDLTKEVCLTLTEGKHGYSADEIRDAAFGISDMQSANGATHLYEIMCVMGSKLSFSLHYGDFNPFRPSPLNTDGQFAGWPRDKVSDPGACTEGMPLRYTFWLSEDSYSRVAKLVVTNRAELEEIDLTKPGLYPILETNSISLATS